MRPRIPIAFTLAAILLACEAQPAALAPRGSDHSRAGDPRRLDRERDRAAPPAVAPFHDFQTASDAACPPRSPPVSWRATCRAHPGRRDGIPFRDLAYIEDGGVVDLLQPERPLYEPEQNGKLRFVGGEYIVPFADYPATDPAPTLLGQEFAQVPEFGVWGLHIYVGRDNPSRDLRAVESQGEL